MYKPLWALVSLMCLQHSLLETEGTSVNKCDIKQPTKGILNLKHQSNPAKLLNETAAYSLRRCSQICCNTVRCNAYIWRNSEQCFLFYCKIVKDCKVVPYQGTVTGFVSREAVPQGSDGDKTSNDQMPTEKSISNDKPPQGEQEEHSKADPASELNSPVRAIKIQSLIQRGESKARIVSQVEDDANQTKRTLKKHNSTSAANKSRIIATTKKPMARKGTANISMSRPVPVLNSAWKAQKVSHTTTTSLVAALSFGMVFFAAVAVLIGRPWWQQFCAGPAGYNRVTFLMNGK